MTKPPAMPELNPADIVVEIVHKPIGGFAYVNTSGITVTHKPSGISVTVDSSRSQHSNRQAALDKLRSTLSALQSAQPAAAVSDEEIEEIARGKSNHIEFARAILALRPQAVPMTDEQRREVFMAGYEAAEQDATVCRVPPHGWHCTRKAGHEGPCAAVETDDAELVQRGMDRLREAHRGITAQGAQGEQA